MMCPRLDRLPAADRRLVESAILDGERVRWGWECARKRRFRDRGAAAAEASRMAGLHGLPFRIYTCDFCACFHVGKDWRD